MKDRRHMEEVQALILGLSIKWEVRPILQKEKKLCMGQQRRDS